MPAHSPLPDDPIELARANWVKHGWDDAAEGMALVTSVMRVQQVFLARIEEILRPLGLTFARYEVLRLLAFTLCGLSAYLCVCLATCLGLALQTLYFLR